MITIIMIIIIIIIIIIIMIMIMILMIMIIIIMIMIIIIGHRLVAHAEELQYAISRSAQYGPVRESSERGTVFWPGSIPASPTA